MLAPAAAARETQATTTLRHPHESAPMPQPNDNVTNLFIHRSAAQRYAAARPYFHPLVAQKITAFTQMPRFNRALDIACGTGQSSHALAAIANTVDAIDISPDMLAQAQPHNRIHFQQAPAENLPFPDNSFDLATVGLAFHWFDQAKFLTEAHRVLQSGGGGWLVIYTSGFDGEMVENPDFKSWAWDIYLKRFPTPPRRSVGVTPELVEPHGFTLAAKDTFAHNESMTAEQLTGYLLTQTNVIAAVESGSTPLPDAASWIAAGLTPFFTAQPATMKFSGSIWYLHRTAQK
jgi:SAM-dependent methyltransferase